LPRGSQEGGSRSSIDEIVVSNSSVIIALARACRLDLLERLFSEVLVPEAVWNEISIEGKPRSEKIAKAGFIRVKKARNRRLVSLLEDFVDEGEAEAIALAMEVGADLLLLDDRDARRLARRLDIQVMGTLGVLALAKYRGIILEVKTSSGEVNGERVLDFRGNYRGLSQGIGGVLTRRT